MRRLFWFAAVAGVGLVSCLLLWAIGEVMLLSAVVDLRFEKTTARVDEVRELENDIVRVWYSYEVNGKTYEGAHSVPKHEWSSGGDGAIPTPMAVTYLVALPWYSYVDKDQELRRAKFSIISFSIFLLVLLITMRRVVGNSEAFEAYRRALAGPDRR